MKLIVFTTVAPSQLLEELTRQGHNVHECLAISEVLALTEEHADAQIVIAADVDDERARVIARKHPTVRLNPTATVAEIIFELSHPAASERVE